MTRKKISTATNNAAAVIDLDDDEQLVEEVTTIKRTGKQRTPKPAAGPPAEPVALDLDDDDLDADDDAIEAEPVFSETSLAALIYNDGEPQAEDRFCSIAIRRNPDNTGDRFAVPCRSQIKLPPMRNVELTAERMDIEELVRNEHGGGHYWFQIHFDGRLRSTWNATLSDPPAGTRAAEAAPAAATPAPAAADPMDKLLADFRRMKELKELMGGGDDTDLRVQIAELKAEIVKAQATPAEPKTERLLMFEQALSTQSPELQTRLINHLFPPDEGGTRSWIADVAELAVEHADKLPLLAQTVGSLLGGLLGTATPLAALPPQPQPSITDMMRSQPPGELPPSDVPPQPSPFRRRDPSPLRTSFDETMAKLEAEAAAGAEAADVPVQAFIDHPPPIELVPDADDERIDEGNEIDDAVIDAEIEPETDAPPRNDVRKKRAKA